MPITPGEMVASIAYIAFMVVGLGCLGYLLFSAFKAFEVFFGGSVEKALSAKRNQIWELAKKGDALGLEVLFRNIGVSEEEALSMLGFASIDHLIAAAQDENSRNLLLALAGTRRASKRLREGLGKWKQVGRNV